MKYFKIGIIVIIGVLLLLTGYKSHNIKLLKQPIETYEMVDSMFLYDKSNGFPAIFELKKDRFGNLFCESNNWGALDDSMKFCDEWKLLFTHSFNNK